MNYEVQNNAAGINWNAKGVERILQNVANLLNTFQYEVAYNRAMGLPYDLLDMPLNQIRAKLTTAVINMVNTYEPRAKVKKVEIANIDNNGNVNIKVVVDI